MNGLSHWQRYTEELYNWIQRKYFELTQGKIDKDTYYEYLAFYESEIQLITLIIENDPAINDFIEASSLRESEFYIKQHEDLSSFIETRFKNSVGDFLPQEKLPEISNESTHGESKQAKQETQPERSPTLQKRIEQIQETVNKRLQEKVQEIKTQANGAIQEQKKITTIHSKLLSKKQFRLLFLGDSGTGKSSVRKIIEGKKFITQQLPVIGAIMSFKNIIFNNENYKVFMIDIGKTDNRASREGFYRNSDAVLLFFDLTNEDQFVHLDSWINEIKMQTIHKIPIYLVGTHKDKKQKVKKKRIENLISVIEKQQITPFPPRFFAISIKDEKGIQKMLQVIMQDLIYMQRKQQ